MIKSGEAQSCCCANHFSFEAADAPMMGMSSTMMAPPPPPLCEHDSKSDTDEDDALCEILGLTSLDGVADANDDVSNGARSCHEKVDG